MAYSASNRFVIRRALCGLCFVGVAVLIQQQFEFGIYILWLAALTVLWILVGLANQMLRPKQQIEVDVPSNIIRIRFMTLVGGWGRSQTRLDRVASVDGPRELGSSSFRRMGFPHFARPVFRLVDLYEIDIGTDTGTYTVVGCRQDLERSEAIRYLRSIVV